MKQMIAANKTAKVRANQKLFYITRTQKREKAA